MFIGIPINMSGGFNIKLLNNLQEFSTSPVFIFVFFDPYCRVFHVSLLIFSRYPKIYYSKHLQKVTILTKLSIGIRFQ